MPFNRPSMTELVDRVASDIEARLPGSDARLRRSNLGVLSRVVAGVAHGLYGFGSYQAKQIVPTTAEGEILDEHAITWGVTRAAAASAAGSVTFAGLNGTSIPAGTIIQRSDGARFVTQAIGVIAFGVSNVQVKASEAGVAGNTAANTRLALAAQILGVNATVTVGAGGLVGGTDVEADDSLRDRLLFRIRKPPQGGATNDYEAWAREVPGVTRAWVKPSWLGPGTVGVFFVRDDDVSIFPDAGEVAAVQAYIDARRPVTAQVTVLAPTQLLVNMTITSSPNTPEVQAAIRAELEDVFRREASPGGTILLSHLREAISLALGETDHVITVPAGNVVAGPGEMPILGVITWA